MYNECINTWDKYLGKLWYICGLIFLPLSIILMLFVIGQSEDIVGNFGTIICMVQLIPLIGSIFHTENALKKILIRMETNDKIE